jgi:hypothetical protein
VSENSAEFKHGQMDTNDDYHTSWLTTQRMDMNSAQVEKTILDDQQTIIQDLSNESELSIRNAKVQFLPQDNI